jgi:hypothetical protein
MNNPQDSKKYPAQKKFDAAGNLIPSSKTLDNPTILSETLIKNIARVILMSVFHIGGL